MGTVRTPEKVKLITGLISNEPGLLDDVRVKLGRMFGRVDYESPLINFDTTDYYTEELGRGLKRKFISYERLVNLKDIQISKIRTNILEKRFSKSGKRRINIDPGYLDLSKLVLFSTKDYSHRVHIGDGIYAEVTLFYKDRTFNPWPWTYPDYKTGSYIDVFNTIREIYKRSLEK